MPGEEEQANHEASESSNLRFRVGQVIDGRYEILGYLARGGMGVLYRVRQVLLGEELVLKTIDAANVSESAVRRFQREAKASFSLNHPNIVHVGDFGLLDGEIPFFTMELLHGETMRERFKRLGSLSADEAIGIFIQVCFGLAHAHRCGIVHRDVKPSNVMLIPTLPIGSEGSVKILDFGIAKLNTHEDGEVQALTRTGEVFGSPVYMSPEQCAGGKVDHRSDIYSLGCALFEALTGAPPFVGDTVLATMMKHQNETAPTLSQASLGAKFSPSLERIVAKLMAKEPDLRYQDLAIVAHELSRARTNADSEYFAGSHPLNEADNKRDSLVISKSSFYLLTGFVALFSAAISALFCVMMLGKFKDEQIPTVNAQNQPVSESKLPPESKDSDEFAHLKLTPNLKKYLDSALKNEGKLHIPNVDTTTEDLQKISEQRWITQITFTSSSFPKGSLNTLAALPNLVLLDLTGCSMTKEGFLAIGKIKTLKVLKLSETSLDDSDLANLAGTVKTLQNLDVALTRVTDVSLSKLIAPELQDIYLDHTAVTDKSLPNLLSLKKLHHLNLTYTDIDDQGLLMIARDPVAKEIKVSPGAITLDGLIEFCKSVEHPMLLNPNEFSREDCLRLRSQHFKFVDVQVNWNSQTN